MFLCCCRSHTKHRHPQFLLLQQLCRRDCVREGELCSCFMLETVNEDQLQGDHLAGAAASLVFPCCGGAGLGGRRQAAACYIRRYLHTQIAMFRECLLL